MGYSETLCQLCGVSFAIARVRRPDEPVEAAWCYYGEDYVEINQFESICHESTGCTSLKRQQNPADEEVGEHIAGPGCCCLGGYSGYRIALEEMKGCRSVQCLMKKDKSWQTEVDDQDFEISSNYFLTGLGDGSPDESPLENIKPARHGIEDALLSNWSQDDDSALPFHPTCFQIFKQVSKLRSGQVDVHGLWEWRTIDGFKVYDFPREYRVAHAQEQWWVHEAGSEYLVANPVDIPGLPAMLSSVKRTHGGWNANDNVRLWIPYEGRGHPAARANLSSTDYFGRLPKELISMVLGQLSSKDIANLRLVSPVFRELPTILFRKLVLADIPWLWEAREMPIGDTDWFELYKMAKFVWCEVKGLKNRRRIWQDIEGIIRLTQKYRELGKILD